MKMLQIRMLTKRAILLTQVWPKDLENERKDTC